MDLVAVLDRLLVLHGLLRPRRRRGHGLDGCRRFDDGLGLYALQGFHGGYGF